MAQKKRSSQTNEPDSTFLLKLVLYIILGSLWLKFQTPLQIGELAVNGLPLGLIVGLIFASHDHFQIDRKIEYAVLIIVTIVTFFLPAGILL